MKWLTSWVRRLRPANRPKITEWFLDDGAALAKEFPYTFWKPSAELTGNLAPDDFVKLIFQFADPVDGYPNAERMWVKIARVGPDGFVGTLSNTPYYIASLEFGDVIHFQEKHIIDASIDDPVPDPTLKWQPKCIATDRILQDGENVGRLYREAPDHDNDSGWRFMANDETQDYLDNAENSHEVSLGAVLRCDDRIIHLLDRPAPVTFEWNHISQNFDEM